MARFPVGKRKCIRHVEKSASSTPDPVERLRFLQQRMKSIGLPAPRRWQLSDRTRMQARRLAVAIAAVLTLAILIWRAI
jgi:hypothetical protein